MHVLHSIRFVALSTSALLALGFVIRAGEPDVQRGDLKLDKPAPVADGRVARVEKADQLACGKCHASVLAEWASSAHGLSWVDPIYQEDVKEKKRPEGCWGCHTPEPLHQGVSAEKPPARAAERDFGVRCESCHAGQGGEVFGPFGAATDAHKSVKHDDFIGAGRNALCSSCHRTTVGPVIGVAKDFETAKLGERGLTCVGCHMQPMTREIANSATGEAPKEFTKREGRSHELQTPRDPKFLRQAFAITARIEGQHTIVKIENEAGHRVPGLVGRSIKFKAEALDADGKSIASGDLEIDNRAYLPVSDSLEITLDKRATKVRVLGRHIDPRLDKPTTFCDEQIAPGASK